MKTPAELYEEYVFRLNKILSEDLLPEIEKTEYDIKVIHDPLWGSRLFYPWEIALIDTPLCQRLRRIYQLGTAYLTYPSAVHTRFSHSLGVTILAGRLITRLREKAEILGQNITITKRDIYTVRLAGILHDIGHTFFSHASEQVLGPILDPIKKHLNEITIDDIYIVFPKTPTMNEAASGPVINILGTLEAMDKYFDLEGWRVTYDLKKLRGYFFATDKVKLVVAKAIEKYIDKKYDLRFDESAKLEAKIIS